MSSASGVGPGAGDSVVFLVSLVWMDKVWSSRGPEDKGAAGNYWFWVWAGPTIAGALFPERSRPQCGPADSSPERSDSEGCSPGAASARELVSLLHCARHGRSGRDPAQRSRREEGATVLSWGEEGSKGLPLKAQISSNTSEGAWVSTSRTRWADEGAWRTGLALWPTYTRLCREHRGSSVPTRGPSSCSQLSKPGSPLLLLWGPAPLAFQRCPGLHGDSPIGHLTSLWGAHAASSRVIPLFNSYHGPLGPGPCHCLSFPSYMMGWDGQSLSAPRGPLEEVSAAP